MTRFAALLLSLLLISGTTTAQQLVSDPALASCRVTCHTGGGSQSGSGTAIGPQLVVTNHHVVSSDGGQILARVTVVHQSGWRSSGQVIAADPRADLALVQLLDLQVHYVSVSASPPQLQQRVRLFGYGGDGILKRGLGLFRDSRGQIGNGISVWVSTCESVSGDSGGGLFDDQGALVAVNWGRDEQYYSQSTAATHVLELLRSWCGRYGYEPSQFCPGGQCAPQYPGGGGYSSPFQRADPKEPILLQPQSPISQPQQPLVPVPPITPAAPSESLSDAQISQITDEIWKRIQGDESFRGPAGPRGVDGVSPSIDYSAIAAAVVAQLPPVTMEIIDGDDVFRQAKPLGQPIRLEVRGLLDAAAR